MNAKQPLVTTVTIIIAAAVGLTVARVGAQPAAPAAPIAAPTVTAPPPVPSYAIANALDAMRPVQLPIWTTAPTGPCTPGEMALAVLPTGSAIAAAAAPTASVATSLYVCGGTSSSATCVATKPLIRQVCTSDEATCTAGHGTTPGRAMGGPCGQLVACYVEVPQCTSFRAPLVGRWERVTSIPAP